MSDAARMNQENKTAGIRDFFVVLFCLGAAAASLYMFQHDLFNTLRSYINLPAGTVTVKHNTVQRRFKDRMIWDRLYEESPVYNGDLIRVARLSGAVISIDNNNIELGENTLIRIHRDVGPANLEFISGEINIASLADSDMILLSFGDMVVQVPSGTVLGASSGEYGNFLNTMEGVANFIDNGKLTPVPAGTVIMQDAQGREITESAAFIIRPGQDAPFLKTGDRPRDIKFEWRTVNMSEQDTVRLEIAKDQNFTKEVQVLDDLDSSAVAYLDSGIWYWRLLREDTALTTPRRITVTEAAAPALFDAVVSGQNAQLRWQEVRDAAAYHLQISNVQDFLQPISVEVQVPNSFIPDLDYGTWYWRVRPIFSSLYEGTTSFSPISSFEIKSAGLPPVSLNTPKHESPVVIGDPKGIFFSWSNSMEAVSYTIKISSQSDLQNPVTATVPNNFFKYGWDDASLVPGRYYWSVSYEDARGVLSPPAQTMSFFITEREIIQRLVSPLDRHIVEEERLSALRFIWETDLLSDRRLQVSPREDFSVLTKNESVGENFYQGLSLPLGEWYWRVSARQSSMSQPFFSSPRRFTVISATQAAAEEERPAPSGETNSAESSAPLRLRLVSPSGSSIPGLTALRQPTVFRWESDEEIASSRFVLSRNANPAQGRPEVERIDPGRAVTVNAPLAEGLWYWTVIAQSRDGRPVTAAAPGQFRVLPVPLLPAPGNRRPESGHSIGAEELRQHRNIVFSWNAVEGATSYILTIYNTSQGRREIFRTGPITRLSYTFENLDRFDYTGNYVWQVEALYYNRQGVIEQRGQPGENTFTLNVPRTGRIQARDTGVLYGN